MGRQLWERSFFCRYRSETLGYWATRGGEFYSESYESADALYSNRPRGFAHVLWTFFPIARKCVLLYPEGDQLILQVGTICIDLINSNARLDRQSVFPGIKRVTAFVDERVMLELHYFHTDLSEDGGHDVLDFFITVIEIKTDPLRLRRFMAIWKAIADGAPREVWLAIGENE
jgi:hypothetical protein